MLPKFFMLKSQREKLEAVAKKLSRNSGKTMEQWMELVRKKGPGEKSEQVDWLKINHALSAEQAKVVVKMMHEGLADYDEDDLMKHFPKSKEYLKPIYDKVISSMKKRGQFTVAVNKTYLSLVNSHQFAILKSSKEGLIIAVQGTAVRTAKSKNFDRVKNSGSKKITHKILLNDVTEVNEDLLKVLTVALKKN